MIPQNTNTTQEILTGVFKNLPVVLPNAMYDGAQTIYLLITELNDDLNDFIYKGIKTTEPINIFPQKREQELVGKWGRMGLSVTYRSQMMDCMHSKINIVFPQISKPKTDINIVLIPWFMLPDRPYPIFLYIFSILHYLNTGKKSLRQSAEAAGEVFGVNKLNGSTVYRNIKAMENFIEALRLGAPLDVEERGMPPVDEMVSAIVDKIISGGMTVEGPEAVSGIRAVQKPAPVKRTEKISYALGNIPCKHTQVIKDKEGPRSRPDKRKRPARRRRKRYVQRKSEFIKSEEIKRIRSEFINICRCLVLNTAATYHKFLM